MTSLLELLGMIAKTIGTLGFVYSGFYVLGAVATCLQKQWKMMTVLIFLTPISFICGLGTPLFDKILISYADSQGGGDIAILFCFLSGIIALIWFAFMGFLPTIIAYKRNYESKKLIFILNWLIAIPLVWPILLYLAYSEEES